MTVQTSPHATAPVGLEPYQGAAAAPLARPLSLAGPTSFHGRISTKLDPRLSPISRKGFGRVYRIAAVIPCYNRAKDAQALLNDLGRLYTPGIELWVILVDNASTTPLSSVLHVPDHIRIEHVRLENNLGGAGGFNAGMSRVLRGEGLSAKFDAPDFIWLIDSDARVTRRCLRELVRGLLSRDDLAAVGSALVDPVTRQTYEIGGKLRALNGYFVPAAKGDVDHRFLVESHYLAACSTLVRREAIERTGLMPEIFIHGDDVEWFLQMTQKTGMKVAGVPRSIAFHPLWSRKFQTWVRYYTTRNAYAPIDACGFGGLTRLHRGLVDASRAAAQAMMGLPELAEMHLQGMADAAAGHTKGFGPRGGIAPIIASIKTRPYAELAQFVRQELAAPGSRGRLYFHPLMYLRMIDFKGLEAQADLLGVTISERDRAHWKHRALDTRSISDAVKALVRALRPARADVAIVPTGWPTGWFRAPTLVQLTSEGFLVRRINKKTALRQAVRVLGRGALLAVRLAFRKRQINELPPAPTRPPLKLAGE